MQPLGHTARRAGLLAALLFLYFVAVSYQANRTRTVSAARDAVLTTVSPVQRLVAASTGAIHGAWSSYRGLLGAAERNRLLEAEVESLRRQLRSAQEMRRENERLRSLVGLDDEVLRAGRAARVIGRDAAHRYLSVTIDRGWRDGVGADAAVISPDGAVVGRVVDVAPWTSLVQLITDPLAGAGGRLQSSRATGLVVGADGPLLQLRYVDSLTTVQRGEQVLTSGDEGIYPAGLLIGHVVDTAIGAPVPDLPSVPLAREQGALFLDVTVRPAVAVDRLETVLVLQQQER